MSLYFIKETAYAGSVLYIFGQLDGHLKWNFINLTGSTAMPCVKLFESTPFSFFANKVVNKNSDTINSKKKKDASVNWILQARILGVGCHFLLQGIFPTQRSIPCVLHLLH